MPSIEEVRAGIEEKRIDREIAVKRIWTDIEKKRKEMNEYVKKMNKVGLIQAPTIPHRIRKTKIKKKKEITQKIKKLKTEKKKDIPTKESNLKEGILSLMKKDKHRTIDFFVEKLGKPKDEVEFALRELEKKNKVLERVVEAASGTEVFLWMRKM